MRVLFLYQSFEESHALGALIRRRGVRDALEASGLDCRDMILSRRSQPIAEAISVDSSRLWSGEHSPPAYYHVDGVFLEGLPLALTTIRKLRKRTKALIHVDVCDSWVRLSDVGLGEGSSIRALTVRRLKFLFAVMMLRYVSFYADSVSYISTRDLAADSQYLHRKTNSFVIPNGSPFSSTDVKKWNRGGPMIVVGDWSYAPNKQMLRDVISWYKIACAEGELPELHILGPNLELETSFDNSSIQVIGWVPDIADAYAEASCAIALTRSGAGVKNKVLEPLSYGIPVIATDDALNGIAFDPSMVLRYRDGLTAAETSKWLDGLVYQGTRRLFPPTWEECVTPLYSFMVHGVVS